MDRAVGPHRSTHVICGSYLGVVAVIGCAYFSYLGYTSLRSGNPFWLQNWWNVVTWLVWLALSAALLLETHCWRERLFFGLLAINFAIGCAFSAWNSFDFGTIKAAREFSVGLWVVAALIAALALLSRRSERT